MAKVFDLLIHIMPLNSLPELNVVSACAFSHHHIVFVVHKFTEISIRPRKALDNWG
ncbi:MAG: hypothetical protein K1X54_06765 [Flavobacteriales bacterium]|nr:hypothetical protein [Flavobacteriales bacterium]